MAIPSSNRFEKLYTNRLNYLFYGEIHKFKVWNSSETIVEYILEAEQKGYLIFEMYFP